MPPAPAAPKPDSRTPKELARAILQHEFTPATENFLGETFRERLLDNAEDGNPQAQRLYTPLSRLAGGLPLDMRHRQGLARALQVLAAYKADSIETRDRFAIHANPVLIPRNEPQAKARRLHEIHGLPAEDARREAHDAMTSAAIEIGNLQLIERLVHSLAAHPQVNVKLIEPGRHRE